MKPFSIISGFFICFLGHEIVHGLLSLCSVTEVPNVLENAREETDNGPQHSHIHWAKVLVLFCWLLISPFFFF